MNLRIEVWDYDSVGNNDLIGIGNINLQSAMQQGGNSSKLFITQFGQTYSTMEEQLEEFVSLLIWVWEWG